ncbi:MAG: hypothetical protein NPINA01_20950 [Nitrospinaceae bacterium]|nr:MAG: hypothetical protein NPINA01_20950 [Nitrospinaceae bacterium]
MRNSPTNERLAYLLDALPESIALLSKKGDIEFVNRAWNHFAEENFGDTSRVGLGVNYLEVCQVAGSEGVGALNGIKKVIDGSIDFFSLEYPCHSKNEERWFIFNATPVKDRLGGAVVSHVNINHQKRAEEKLNKLSSAIEKCFSSIMITDKRGNIEFVNPFFEMMSGYSLREIVGKNPRLLKSGQHPPDFYRELWEMILAGKEFKSEICNKNKNGDLYWELQSITPIFDYREKITNFIAVGIDVTQQKADREKLGNYSAQLKIQHEELQSFISIAYHDLREPLRKIVLLSDRIKKGITENQKNEKDYLERLQKSALRLNQLIEGLLKYSRVTAPSNPRQKVHLKQIVEEVIDDLEAIILETKTDIQVNSLPALRVDVFQIRLLFQHLIRNAIQFCKKDIPPVVKIYSQKARDNSYKIFFEDNGVGFDEKYSDRIFQPLQQLQDRKTHEGVGMGLAICKKIVEGMNGEISVTSKPGKGSTFIIHLKSQV